MCFSLESTGTKHGVCIMKLLGGHVLQHCLPPLFPQKIAPKIVWWEGLPPILPSERFYPL